jgi:hypothetical protein
MVKSIGMYIFLFIFYLGWGCAGAPRKAKTDTPPQPVKMETAGNSLNMQLDNLTGQIVTSLSQKQKSKIAVIEFSNLQGRVTEFGRYLAEELITRLYLTNRFEVIERQLLNKVLQEHRLNMTGIIDASSAKELGRILGVDAIRWLRLPSQKMTWFAGLWEARLQQKIQLRLISPVNHIHRILVISTWWKQSAILRLNCNRASWKDEPSHLNWWLPTIPKMKAS